MAVKLSLVVPCYNEESTLSEIVDKVLELKSAFLRQNKDMLRQVRARYA